MTVAQRAYLRIRIREIGNKKIDAILNKIKVPTLNELLLKEGRLYDTATLRKNFTGTNYFHDAHRLVFKNFDEIKRKHQELTEQRDNNPKILAIEKEMKELEDAAMFLKEPEVIKMLKEFEQK